MVVYNLVTSGKWKSASGAPRKSVHLIGCGCFCGPSCII